MSLHRTLSKLRNDLKARAAQMLALRPDGPFPAPEALGDLAADQLLETHGADELAQWSTAELWSEGYRLLHDRVLDTGFRRDRTPEHAPLGTPTAPPAGAPYLRLVKEEPAPAAEPADPAAAPAEPAAAPAEAPPPAAPQGFWQRAHVQIAIDGLPEAERRYLLTLLATDDGPTAARRSGWPGGDAAGLVPATRQLLLKLRTTVEEREAAYRAEGLA